MSDGNDDNKQNNKKEIILNVDNKEMRELIEQLHQKDDTMKQLKLDLEKLDTKSKEAGIKLEEMESIQTELEQAKEQMRLLGEQQVAEKRKIIMDEAKKYITDESRLKQIESNMKTIKDVQATEYMIKMIGENLVEGQKQHEEMLKKEREEFEKKLEEAKKISDEENKDDDEDKDNDDDKGDNDDEDGTGKSGDNVGKGSAGRSALGSNGQQDDGKTYYESNAAMVRDLIRKENSADPEVSAKAKSTLDEIWDKLTVAIKDKFEGQLQGGYLIDGDKIGQPLFRDLEKDGGAAVPVKPEEVDEKRRILRKHGINV
jgi:DNA repair exonuclease SbcCD ATPase subunit